MDFVGQYKIIKELNSILPLANQGRSYNILLSARTGYGKTLLGLKMVRQVATWQILVKEDANAVLFSIDSMKTRANLIDEVHLVKNIELLYPMMDSGEYFLVFATNQGYDLPEAFKRRCINLIFEKYKKPELIQIARDHLNGFRFEEGCLEEIIKASNYTPGNIANLCIRIQTMFWETKNITLASLKDIIVNIFNIQDGLDVRCREYLEVLERIHIASLDSMAYIMGVNKDVIRTEVESVLLNKNLIQITSKGRSLK
jgi:Holliday junction resolvasome RuvABC ATP-dependent DNA helicase subunit